MHVKNYIRSGKELGQADKVLIMIHGRGADAGDILALATYFDTENFTLIAPQAVNHTWYPYSFLAPVSSNEPWLSSAISVLQQIVEEAEKAGISKTNIYFLGFSQGACLALEYVARNASEYGGVVAFTGGLIGPGIDEKNYKGNFNGAKIFIGTSDPDPHVPVQRVNESALVLEKMGASVTKKIYKNMGHSVNQDEIDEANRLIFSSASALK
jgi:phospholipase/carboxylesterase